MATTMEATGHTRTEITRLRLRAGDATAPAFPPVQVPDADPAGAPTPVGSSEDGAAGPTRADRAA